MTEAVKETGANASVIFVPPPGAADAILEAADAGLELTVCITEGIPVLDMARTAKRAACGSKMRLRRARTARVSSRRSSAGSASCRRRSRARAGRRRVALRHPDLRGGRSALALGIGQSTCLGIGGDPVIGTNFIDALTLFEADPETKAVVMIGEIGGSAEEEAAEFVKSNMTKPVVGLHRGPERPARQAHGARRCNHRRRQGQGGRQDRGPRGERRARRGARRLCASAP